MKKVAPDTAAATAASNASSITERWLPGGNTGAARNACRSPRSASPLQSTIANAGCLGAGQEGAATGMVQP
jgi:hypothetical protein